ncbi:MAG: transglutaminase-like cysteine peptidase [Bacteriovoracaceae bacterium]|jgi:predicted transglutaminase-like cysteine proteinase|nr:hypothetical protein [Halobacteriovoraceae bacterium]MAX68036.1 hypothetical protein [Halobacteriovoraceae bacterium]MDP7320388.1 transglutaminase-like cysteine peptidase [Bacteriovoracaceae bacterium]
MKNFLIKKIFFLLLILGLYSHSAMTAESLTGKAKMDQLIGEYERRARQANTLEQKVLILIETMKGKINPHDLRDIYYTARFVNRLFNQQITFKSDSLNYQKEDYFASLEEVTKRTTGDCEDYALAKFTVLKEIGIPEERMALVYGQATEATKKRYGTIGHMVLAIYQPDQKESYLILDNIRPESYLTTNHPYSGSESTMLGNSQRSFIPIYAIFPYSMQAHMLESKTANINGDTQPFDKLIPTGVGKKLEDNDTKEILMSMPEILTIAAIGPAQLVQKNKCRDDANE